MTTTNFADEQLRYPVGRLVLPEGALMATERAECMRQVANLPGQLTAAARAVGGERLQLPYRPGGWDGRQVIHHVADSHLNCYFRYRLALT